VFASEKKLVGMEGSLVRFFMLPHTNACTDVDVSTVCKDVANIAIIAKYS